MNKILIIDDNELVSDMLKHSLSEQGFAVSSAADANAGYKAAVEETPDLILLDVQLPDVTGFDLCKIIRHREELREVPIIMITGTARTAEEKVRGFRMGVDDYVLKPFEMPELIERVRALLRRRESQMEADRRLAPAIPSGPSARKAAGTVIPPAGGDSPLTLTIALRSILLDPFHFPARAQLPSVGRPFLLAAISLAVLGLAVSSGASLRPLMGGILVAGIWGILLSVLVISGSLFGISLTWREGASLLSLAGIPVLLKLGCGLASALATTLSPFYFTASPALFLTSGVVWARRLDLFELWSVFLLVILLRGRPNCSDRKARWIAALVWAAAALLTVAFESWEVGL